MNSWAFSGIKASPSDGMQCVRKDTSCAGGNTPAVARNIDEQPGHCPLLNFPLQNVEGASELFVLSGEGVLEWAENSFGPEPD